MALTYRRNLLGDNGRILKKFVLNASLDFQVGDVVTYVTGSLTGEVPEDFNEVAEATAGKKIVGVIQAIITATGVAPSSNGCGGVFVDQFRTAANNETGAQICALVDMSPFSLYSADLDDTIGTTTGSNRAGYYLDLDTGDTSSHRLNEASAEALGTVGGGQFLAHGVDPQDTDNIIVNIAKSVLSGDTGV
mgnify:FL=1